MRRKVNAALFSGMILILAFQEMSEGAEWSVTPAITLRQDYDDNILLTTQPHNSVTSTTVSPRLEFGVRSYIWSVGGAAELSRRRFPGNSELDTDAQNLNLGSLYQTERSTWQLNAASSKTSYVAEQNINPNIGLFSQNRNVDTRSISPSWAWSMTELTQLQLAYSQSDVSYVNGQSIGLFDYRSSSVSVNLTNHINIDTQIFLSSVYSIYRVPATTLESKTTSYQIGITRKFSETMNGTLSLGGRNTTSEQVVDICTVAIGPFCFQTVQETFYSRGSSSIFNANFERQFETVKLTAAASRSFDPTARGQQAQTDSVSLALSRPLTPLMTGSLSVSGYKLSSETGNDANIGYKFYQIQPSLDWKWSPEWNLGMSYSYRHLQRVYETTAATSNAAYLTLMYQWPKNSVSR